MLLSDIVTQLTSKLPMYTSKFTNDVSVASLTRSGTLVTAVCHDAHGLKVGKPVTIMGAKTPITITTLVRSGVVGTLETVADHDLTYSPKLPMNLQGSQVVVAGANEAEFNGTFNTLSVKSRRVVNFQMVDSGPIIATGSPLLMNGFSIYQDYNGTYPVVSAPEDHIFVFEHSNIALGNPLGTITARTAPRISAGSDIARLQAAYTEQQANQLWMFATFGDVLASKSRHIFSDAVDNIQAGHEYRQQLVQPLSVYVFIPTADDISGRRARDLAEELFQPICKSVLFKGFDSGLYSGAQGRMNFVSHGVLVYDSAIYVHQYIFQQVFDLTWDDTVGFDDDVAMSGFDLTIFPRLGADIAISSFGASVSAGLAGSTPFPDVGEPTLVDATIDPLTADSASGDDPLI